MQYPVNLVVELQNEEEQKAAENAVQLLKDMAENNSEAVLSKHVEILDRAILKLVDSTQEARVLINGHVIITGTKEEMIDRFRTECDMHTKSNVVAQEWVDGDYKQFMARRHQR